MTLVADSEVLAHSVRKMERIMFDLGATGADLMAGLQVLEAKEPELRVSESLALAISACSRWTCFAPRVGMGARKVHRRQSVIESVGIIDFVVGLGDEWRHR
jgi:hypothetical protein